MDAIDYMLRHPNRFSKRDIHEAALQLRAEIDLLNSAAERTLSSNPDREGNPS
jgi:hypothetical protein